MFNHIICERDGDGDDDGGVGDGVVRFPQIASRTSTFGRRTRTRGTCEYCREDGKGMPVSYVI